jgi:hypothetical protein
VLKTGETGETGETIYKKSCCRAGFRVSASVSPNVSPIF